MILCPKQPTPKVLSEAHPQDPETLRHPRGVFIFSLAMILCATGSLTGQSASNIGEVYASDAAVKGSVQQTSSGLDVGNGSVVTAGEHSATLRLARGGQVRICPGTNLTVNSSPNGKELMLAMSAGSLEGSYRLPAAADAVLTPDFRILISGPADVNVSITANEKGDTCVRSRGDQSYVVVSELMGDDFYRIRPNEQVIFRAGHAKDPQVGGDMVCGCPAPAAMPEHAQNNPAPAPAPANNGAPADLARQAPPPAPTPEQTREVAAAIDSEPAVAATANAAEALPPQSQPGQVQVQVDAPMIFHGNGATPDPTQTLARVHAERLPWPDAPLVSPQAPAVPSPSPRVQSLSATKPKRGFFHKLGGFFSALFKS